MGQPAQQASLPVPSLQALAVSPDNQSVYAVNTKLSVLVVANAGGLTQRQAFKNDVTQSNGQMVTGIGGANAVVVSPDGKFVYVAGKTDKEVAIFSRNVTTGDLTWQQAVGTSGHDVFQALTLSPSGDRLYVAGADGVESFQRDAGTGALTAPAFVASPNGIGSFTGLAVSRDGTLLYAVSPSHDALVVLQSATLTPLSGQQYTVGGASDVAVSADVTSGIEDVYVLGGSSATLAVFQRMVSTNAITRTQTLADGTDGVRGLLGGDGLLVSGDNKFVYVTSETGGSLAVFDHAVDQNNHPTSTLELAQVLRGQPGLDSPAGLASSGASDGVVYVATQSGLGASPGGISTFDPVTLASPPPHTLTVSYSNVQTLGLTTGSSDDFIAETRPADATTVTINTGDGFNTVNLLDFKGNTTVNGGVGNDNVTVRSATGGHLTINAGAGDDFVQLENALAGDVINVNGGAGDDTFLVASGALSASATVTIDGGAPAVAPGDTLLFDSTGLPINPDSPTLPNGTIQISGSGHGKVTYTNIESIPGYVGAKVDAGGPYTVSLGQPLTLSGSATAATDSTILAEYWDVNGDGIFGDASGYNPTIPWSTLVALGLGQPGTYTVGFRVKSDSNTTDDFATLTVKNTAPTLSVNAPPTATLGVPYTITIDGTEVGSSPITGWRVDWGNGTVVDLPSDATSATYTYGAAGTENITVTATDSNGSYQYPNAIHVTVSAGAETLDAGGPYTVQAGSSVVLTATTQGTPTSFQWDINGDGVYTDVAGSVPAPVNGVTTSRATLTWANLQSLLSNNDGPQTLNKVGVKVTYADGSSRDLDTHEPDHPRRGSDRDLLGHERLAGRQQHRLVHGGVQPVAGRNARRLQVQLRFQRRRHVRHHRQHQCLGRGAREPAGARRIVRHPQPHQRQLR